MRVRDCLPILLGGLLSACAAGPDYRSEPLTATDTQPPPPHQARIVARGMSHYPTFMNLSFGCLDGEHVSYARALFGGMKNDLVVAPGRHTVTLVAGFNGWYGLAPMWLDAQPDHLYDVQAKAYLGPKGPWTFTARIVDQTTHRVVGGLLGSQPPTTGPALTPPVCGDKIITPTRPSVFLDPGLAADWPLPAPGQP